MSLLIVCEGLDGAGKTTAIKEILKERDERFVYSKGIGSKTLMGKIARKLPSTFMFFLELLYLNYKIIKPALKKNKIVLQDRYDISVLSYPRIKWYNKLLIKFLNPMLAEADALAYFDVSIEERLKRLMKDKENKYHQTLIKNPGLIKQREEIYQKLYNKFKGKKIRINTANNSIKESSKILEDFIFSLEYTY